MPNNFWTYVIIVLITSAVTFLTRSAPFLLFSDGQSVPRLVTYLGRVMPPAIIIMLVIYCIRNVTPIAYPYAIPEIVGVVATIGLHLWKKNTFLTIGISTVLYMLLVQNM